MLEINSEEFLPVNARLHPQPPRSLLRVIRHTSAAYGEPRTAHRPRNFQNIHPSGSKKGDEEEW